MKTTLTLLLLFCAALTTRTWMIDRYPISLNWDETTFAYNAYSLLQTGKDEYGKKLPLEFKSIGDYKNPMYVYLLVPTIAIYGLSEFSTRLPPALLGALTIPLLWVIVWRLFRNRTWATYSGLLLAISPWHLQFTRAGADVGVGTFFVIFGIALILGNKYIFGLPVLMGGVYSYFGERAIVPVLVTLLAWYSRKEWKRFLVGMFVAAAVLTPLLGSLVSTGHRGKIYMTTLLSYRIPEESILRIKNEDGQFLFGIFHNNLMEYGYMLLDRYANQFGPSFLFIKGLSDNRQRIAEMGMMYWSDLVLICLALPVVLKNTKYRNFKFLVIWLLLAPIPAIITRDPVHARRAVNMIYPLIIFCGIGLDTLVKKSRRPIMLVFTAIFLWSMGLYVCSYYVFTPLQTFVGSAGWQYGYKQLVEKVEPIKDKYQRVVIDTTYQGPYAYFLFYSKYPPSNYQHQARLTRSDPLGLGEGPGYDKYEFRDIFWPADRGSKNTLFAGPPERLPLKDIDPNSARVLDRVYFPDKTVAFLVIETF